MLKKLLGLLTWVVAFNISAHELKTIDEIHSAYKNNKITAQQLTQGYIKRINQLNPQFNAVINIEPTAVTQAKKIGKELKVNFNTIYIETNKILKDLPKILRAAQDWRDYNVHCAVLNYYIGEYISKNFNKNEYIVLTGDFMNDFKFKSKQNRNIQGRSGDLVNFS